MTARVRSCWSRNTAWPASGKIASRLCSISRANVAGIHGVDQADDVCFLALELVPGKDLAACIAT
jgi:hypothetical protein